MACPMSATEFALTTVVYIAIYALFAVASLGLIYWIMVGDRLKDDDR